jgi:hypothetical protein
MANNDDGSAEGTVEKYRNKATKILAKFLPQQKEDGPDPLASIDFSAPKAKKTKLEALAQRLEKELSASEWFVTGKVNPTIFSEDFRFQDPDVNIDGIEGRP